MTINHNRTICTSLLIIMLLTGPVSLPSSAAQAQPEVASTLDWTGPDDGVWSSPDNWQILSGANHAVPQNGDTLVFQKIGVTSYNDMDNLRLDSIGINADKIKLQGKGLTLSREIGIAANMRGRVELPLQLVGTADIAVANLSSLTLAGAITGNGSVSKSGAGSLTLETSNTFTNGVWVNAGSLYLNDDFAAGSGPIHIALGGTLLPGGNASVISNPVLLSGMVSVESDARSLTGPLSLNGAVTLKTAGGSLDIAAQIDGTGDLTLNGSSFSLSGTQANTYTGGLLVQKGILTLNKSAGLASVTGAITIGSGVESGGTVRVVTQTDGQFSPLTQINFKAYSSLELNGTRQTIAGLTGRNHPCQLTTDSAAQKSGELLIQTAKSGLDYFYCDLLGSGHITVGGQGLQDFGKNTTPFQGILEVKDSSASYLDGFKASGPYILRAGAAGGFYPDSVTGSTLVDGSWFMAQSGSGAAGRTGGLLLSGDTSFVAEINASTDPVLRAAGPVSLGNVKLYACYQDGQLPDPGQPRVLIQNDGSQAIDGAFANLPEGAQGTLQGCLSGDAYPLRISYQGGDGNEVAITRLVRNTLTLFMQPDKPEVGQSVTLQTWLQMNDTASPALGQPEIQFFDGQQILGSMPVVNGYATLTGVKINPGIHQIQARLSQDPTFADATSNTIDFRSGKQVYLPLTIK